MRRLAAAIAFVAAVHIAGCHDKPGPSTPGGAPSTTKREPEHPAPKDPLAELPQTLDLKYEGRNAEFWGEKLLDASDDVSNHAGAALQQLRGEGLRFLVKGMKSEIEHVQYHSVHSLDYESAKKYPSVMVPMLTALLESKNPRPRLHAAAAIGQCGFRECLPALKKAADKEQDERVKGAMKYAVGSLEKLTAPPPA